MAGLHGSVETAQRISVSMSHSRFVGSKKSRQSPASPPAKDPGLRRLELAEALRVSPATVDRWKRKHKIPFVKVDGYLRFDLTKVLVALQRYEHQEVGR